MTEATKPAARESGAGDILIGISACLMGQRVRFDGGHKKDGFICETLGKYVRFHPVCPEVEVGMGTPRETVRLEGKAADPVLMAPKSGADWTERMKAYALRKVETLAALEFSGFILKKDSPSCGMERVRVYDHNGVPSKTGRGLFAAALLERFPFLPIEEEGRLQDPRLRENFVERVFAYRRMKDFFASPWRGGDLVRFHTAEKLLLLAHEPVAYQSLGRLVAAVRKTPRKELATTYQETYMRAMTQIATTRRHVNVLQHMAGYFKDILGPEDRKEMAGLIADFQKGLVPLVVPLTLIRHYVRSHLQDHGVAYLQGQVYLEPHPKELMLRNHV